MGLYSECVAANYGNGISLIEKGNNYVEFIHICANSGYEKIDPFLSTNIDCLWNYVLFIREKVSKDLELKRAYQNTYQYNLNFNSVKNTEPNNLFQFAINKYYLGGNFGDIYFTKRELECLILLYKDFTSKQQSKILNISHRTIEHIIENIKQKTGYRSTLNLVVALANNQVFRSLIL